METCSWKFPPSLSFRGPFSLSLCCPSPIQLALTAAASQCGVVLEGGPGWCIPESGEESALDPLGLAPGRVHTLLSASVKGSLLSAVPLTPTLTIPSEHLLAAPGFSRQKLRWIMGMACQQFHAGPWALAVLWSYSTLACGFREFTAPMPSS